MLVRKFLHAKGFRYKLHDKSMLRNGRSRLKMYSRKNLKLVVKLLAV
ncbi:MAG: hypothetical protein ACR2KX_06460 [Chitinophagaceae bacterium]